MASISDIKDTVSTASSLAEDLDFAYKIKELYGGNLKFEMFHLEPNIEFNHEWRVLTKREYKVTVNSNDPFYIGEPQRGLLEMAIKGSIDTSISSLSEALESAITSVNNLNIDTITNG